MGACDAAEWAELIPCALSGGFLAELLPGPLSAGLRNKYVYLSVLGDIPMKALSSVDFCACRAAPTSNLPNVSATLGRRGFVSDKWVAGLSTGACADALRSVSVQLDPWGKKALKWGQKA